MVFHSNLKIIKIIRALCLCLCFVHGGLLGWPVEVKAISNAADRLLSDRRGKCDRGDQTRYVPCRM